MIGSNEKADLSPGTSGIPISVCDAAQSAVDRGAPEATDLVSKCFANSGGAKLAAPAAQYEIAGKGIVNGDSMPAAPSPKGAAAGGPLRIRYRSRRVCGPDSVEPPNTASPQLDFPRAAEQAAKTKPKPAASQATPKKANEAAQPTAGGVVVFKDPVTGQIRQPDASEIGDLLNSSGVTTHNNLTARPTVSQAITGADGSPGMRLGADTLVFMVVTKTADGKLVEECLTGEAAAKAKTAAGLVQKKTEVRDDK